MLPVWVLIPPQIIHSLSHYIICTVVQGVWLQVLKATHREYQKLTVSSLYLFVHNMILFLRVLCLRIPNLVTYQVCLSTRHRQLLLLATL